MAEAATYLRSVVAVAAVEAGLGGLEERQNGDVLVAAACAVGVVQAET